MKILDAICHFCEVVYKDEEVVDLQAKPGYMILMTHGEEIEVISLNKDDGTIGCYLKTDQNCLIMLPLDTEVQVLEYKEVNSCPKGTSSLIKELGGPEAAVTKYKFGIKLFKHPSKQLQAIHDLTYEV